MPPRVLASGPKPCGGNKESFTPICKLVGAFPCQDNVKNFLQTKTGVKNFWRHIADSLLSLPSFGMSQISRTVKIVL